MAVLKLPRLQTGTAIVDHANGKPITALTRFWDMAASQIEDNLNAVIAAQAAADAAQGSADTAQAAADAAQADADAAQATADAAKATADALDAALDVAAGKILHVLNTMTLAGIDGSTLNIGTGGTLGSAAFTNASDYLPAGSSAAFLAKANNLSDVASVATARANLGVTASGADTAYVFRANNLSDLANVATARVNLGVSASGADTAYVWRSNNLSDVANIATARTNLGLGTAAVQNTGTSGATVPLLNGANTWASAQVFGGTVNVAGHTTFEGVTSTGATGTGKIVYDLSPVLTTPNIGVATGTSLTGATLTLGTTGAQPVIWKINNTERAQITPAGYLKASNAGSYYSVGANFHELAGDAAGATALISNTNASPYGIAIFLLNAAPNNTTNYLLYCQDSATTRGILYSNGGLHNYSANNVNLSDAEVKGAVQPYSETELDALERSFLKVNWGKFKYLDQSHSDWNHGYTAQAVEEAFALTAPELVEETVIGTKAGSGEKRKGVYDADLTHIGMALLARALKRIGAVESKMYAAGLV